MQTKNYNMKGRNLKSARKTNIKKIIPSYISTKSISEGFHLNRFLINSKNHAYNKVLETEKILLPC